MRRRLIFSPIVATRWVSSSATLRPVPGKAAPLTASISPWARARSATWRTKFWKASLRATKSVSELTSTTAPAWPPVATPTSPSAATRPAFLAAAARPFLRSQSTAPSISPDVSPSARLQSIMPAPVFSRSSLTSDAVISAIISTSGKPLSSARLGARFFARRRRLGSISRLEIGDDLARNLRLGADVDAGAGELRLQAVEHGTGDEVAIEMNGAHGVVIARNGISDAVGRGIRIENGDNRDLEHVGLVDRDRLLVGVDDEEHVGQTAHLLDAAKRALELVAVARQLEKLALGQAALRLGDPLVELAQAADRVRDGLEIGQHAAEPAVVDVILPAALGGLGDRLLRLALGADEEYAAAAGDSVAQLLQSAVEHRHRLLEVDDMDAVANAEEVGLHLRIPAAGVVAEMNASFEQLAHGEARHRHAGRSFSGWSATGENRSLNQGFAANTGAALSLLEPAATPCEG